MINLSLPPLSLCLHESIIMIPYIVPLKKTKSLVYLDAMLNHVLKTKANWHIPLSFP